MQLAVWTQPYVDFESLEEIPRFLDRLAAGGVELLFPCAKSEAHFTGGKSHAYFATELIDAAPLGDVLGPLCIEAQRRGLAVHPWLCVLLEGDSRFLRAHPQAACCAFDNLNQAARTGMACPAHEETQSFIATVAREILERYPVDGLHLDFIRYPHLRACACAKCRADMQAEIGARPEDIFTSGEARRWWLERRREQVTRLVEALSALAHQARKQVSAAVFCDYPRAVDDVGQDWLAWSRRGLVDLLVFMNYKERLDDFLAAAAGHVALLGRPAPVLQGIAKTTEMVCLSTRELVAQAAAARDMGCAGVCIFAARNLSDDHLAALRALR